MIEKVQQVLKEFEAIEKELADPAVYSDQKKVTKLSRKRKSLEQKAMLAREYFKLWQQKSEAEEMLKTEKDIEILKLAKTELEEAKEQLPKLEEKLRIALIPRDPNDEKNCIIEIRPGAGGDESALFEIGRAHV